MDSSRPKWQKLIRQNSEKIGTLAEAAVLPINQRSIQRTSTSGEITLKNVESQGSDAPYAPTATAPNTLDRQQRYFPIFMIGISLIQVLLMYKTDDDKLLMIFGFDPHRRHEIWRLVTIMLAHSGLSHLWSNVIFQLILGVLLEIVHGWKRIAIIYVSSIVGGSLFISVLSPGTYAVGASAGDYGLLFSHLATIIINWNEMDRKCCRLFWLIFYIAFDVGLNLYSELILQTKSNVSHAGHLGGAITGFLVSILVLKNFEKHPWEEKMQKICIGIVAALSIVIVIINIAAWGLYLPTEWNVDYETTYNLYVLKQIIESPDLSEIRKECDLVPECRQLVEQYKFNGTVPDN